MAAVVLMAVGIASAQVDRLSLSSSEVIVEGAEIGRVAVEPGDEPSQLSRSIGVADPGRVAVEPVDPVDTTSPSSAVSTVPDAISRVPDALAFNEPEPALSEPKPALSGLGIATVDDDPPTPPQPSTPANSDAAAPDPVSTGIDSDGPAKAAPAPAPAPVPGPTPAPAEPATASAVIGDANIVGNDGRIRGGEHAGRSFADVVQEAAPGASFLFESGSHAPIHLNGVHGTEQAPIVIGAVDPSSPPQFTSGSYDKSAGLFISDSSQLVFQDLAVRKSLWGVLIERSSGVKLERLDVRDLGQEGIRVAQRSSWVTIRNSTIADTGRRSGRNSSGQAYSNFAEGIYLGTGSTEDDPVDNVVISGNDISRTGTEAIDIKAPVTNVTVRGNRIHDIDTGTSGAIVVHLAADQSAVNPGIRIEGNEIWNITTSTEWQDGVGIVVGSSVDVVNNTFRNLEHYGIRVEDGGAQGANITARIEGNTFSQIGRDAVWAAADRATLQLSNNVGIS